MGSDEGAFTACGIAAGVTGAEGRPVILRANFLNGEIVLDIVLVALGALLAERDILGGVSRYPFLVETVVTDVVEPLSLILPSPLSKIVRTLAISESALAMRSLRVFQRFADSACRLSVSPFFVTRS